MSCTPEDPALVKPQQCFLGVLAQGSRVTVCTTFEGHAKALEGSGGKLATVAYGCTLGDIVCITFENAGRAMAIMATAMMFTVSQNMRFDTTTLLWTAATQEWSFWQWAVLMVLFGAMVWAIAAAVVSGDREQIVGAVVRSFIAIPAVPITLWMAGHLLNAVDDLTWYILDRKDPLELFVTLQQVMWAGGQASYYFAFIIHGLLMISMLLLTLVFAFRNIVLAALFAVGPVAWMLYPVRTVGPQWVVRYVSAVAVLLLTGPLTVAFVSLILNGLANVKTIWDPQSWPLLVGLALVAFAPFAVFGLFSFIGAVAADSVGSRLGSGAGRAASNTARSAIRVPSRLGAAPAGVAPQSVRNLGSKSPTPPSGQSGPKGPSGPAGRTNTQTDSRPPQPRTSESASTPTTASTTPARPERTVS
ncbi:hypothetical protein [Microbacterium pumilum]|uniref:Type IV secretion system protein n=1 Tax=Microbacterium pumilum TaxID=344165 RepID=A0ABN2S2K1_9MICO